MSLRFSLAPFGPEEPSFAPAEYLGVGVEHPHEPGSSGFLLAHDEEYRRTLVGRSPRPAASPLSGLSGGPRLYPTSGGAVGSIRRFLQTSGKQSKLGTFINRTERQADGGFFFEVICQRFTPMAKLRAPVRAPVWAPVRATESRQHAVGRTGCGERVLRVGDGDEFGSRSLARSEDLPGKIVPRAGPSVCQVIDDRSVQPSIT